MKHVHLLCQIFNLSPYKNSYKANLQFLYKSHLTDRAFQKLNFDLSSGCWMSNFKIMKIEDVRQFLAFSQAEDLKVKLENAEVENAEIRAKLNLLSELPKPKVIEATPVLAKITSQTAKISSAKSENSSKKSVNSSQKSSDSTSDQPKKSQLKMSQTDQILENMYDTSSQIESQQTQLLEKLKNLKLQQTELLKETESFESQSQTFEILLS